VSSKDVTRVTGKVVSERIKGRALPRGGLVDQTRGKVVGVCKLGKIPESQADPRHR
jgi:hypothetical protein